MQKNITEYKRKYKVFRRKAIIRRNIFIAILLLLFGCIAVALSSVARNKIIVSKAHDIPIPDWIDVCIIDESSGGRSCAELSAIKSIVIHYVGNPGTTAKNNRDYFNKETTTVSSHFIVGLQGEIIQCLPLYEKSAASNNRNRDTISIEVCHPDESGKFNENTYDSVVKLTAWLCKVFYLEDSDIIRHYDITGKICPKYYVENEREWKNLKEKIKYFNGEF